MKGAEREEADGKRGGATEYGTAEERECSEYERGIERSGFERGIEYGVLAPKRAAVEDEEGRDGEMLRKEAAESEVEGTENGRFEVKGR